MQRLELDNSSSDRRADSAAGTSDADRPKLNAVFGWSKQRCPWIALVLWLFAALAQADGNVPKTESSRYIDDRWSEVGSNYTRDAAGKCIGDQVKDPGGTLARSLSRVNDALGRVQQTTGRE